VLAAADGGRPSPCRSHTFFFGGGGFFELRNGGRARAGTGHFHLGTDQMVEMTRSAQIHLAVSGLFSPLDCSSIGKGNPPLGSRLGAVSAMATSA